MINDLEKLRKQISKKFDISQIIYGVTNYSIMVDMGNTRTSSCYVNSQRYKHGMWKNTNFVPLLKS